jgi:demethylmenaquinone methyltransferase/2-methoxy-6-polyprenyl-1,4-benzoquinol methylase
MGTDAYRRLAGIYDRVVEPAASALRRQGLEIVPAREDVAILDVGCGTGTQLALYRRAGCRLAGVDLSPAMVAEARKKLGGAAEIRCEDASKTSYDAGTFDLVMIVTVLHELPRAIRRPVLDEARRVLKPDGRILVMDYHVGPYPFPRGWIWKAVITFMELLAGREHFANYRDFMSSGGLDALVAASGLPVTSRHVPHSATAVVYLLRAEPTAVEPSGSAEAPLLVGTAS